MKTWRLALAMLAAFSFTSCGNDYELLVKKTTLANPPQDDTNVRYELIHIVSQNKKE